MKELLF